MMTVFSGTSILSNEFVVIGRASTDNLGVLLGPRAQCGPCGKKWLKKPKSEWKWLTAGKATLSHLEPLWKKTTKKTLGWLDAHNSCEQHAKSACEYLQKPGRR